MFLCTYLHLFNTLTIQEDLKTKNNNEEYIKTAGMFHFRPNTDFIDRPADHQPVHHNQVKPGTAS